MARKNQVKKPVILKQKDLKKLLELIKEKKEFIEHQKVRLKEIRAGQALERSLYSCSMPSVEAQRTITKIKAEIKEAEDALCIDATGRLKFRALLKKHGYASSLSQLEFGITGVSRTKTIGWAGSAWIPGTCLNDIDFDGLKLNGCQFEGCTLRGARFTDSSSIVDCTFTSSTLRGARVSKTVLSGNRFMQCEIASAKFDGANFNSNEFSECAFYDCDFTHSTFEAGKKRNTIKSSGVFATLLTSKQMEGVDISDSVSDALKIKLERPAIGMLWNSAHMGHNGNKKRNYFSKEHNVIRVDVNPGHIDEEILNREVKSLLERRKAERAELKALKDSNQADSKQARELAARLNLSISEYILEAAKDYPIYTEFMKVREYARMHLQNLQGFILPGGLDIEPELSIEDYDESRDKHPKTCTEPNYIRSILEICLLDEAENYGKPVLGVCRGFQMINVKKGGQVNQDVPGHNGHIGYMDKHAEHGILAHDLHGMMRPVASEHHQGIVQEGKGLIKVASDRGLVKAVEMEHGVPIFGVQFHPEEAADGDILTDMFLSSCNVSILKSFGNAVRTEFLRQRENLVHRIVESPVRKRIEQQAGSIGSNDSSQSEKLFQRYCNELSLGLTREIDAFAQSYQERRFSLSRIISYLFNPNHVSKGDVLAQLEGVKIGVNSIASPDPMEYFLKLSQFAATYQFGRVDRFVGASLINYQEAVLEHVFSPEKKSAALALLEVDKALYQTKEKLVYYKNDILFRVFSYIFNWKTIAKLEAQRRSHEAKRMDIIKNNFLLTPELKSEVVDDVLMKSESSPKLEKKGGNKEELKAAMLALSSLSFFGNMATAGSNDSRSMGESPHQPSSPR